jgi:CubicO group peptidase (beta-lactamase class C family)
MACRLVFPLLDNELFIGEMKMIKINAPESVGMSSSRLNEIDVAMQSFIDEGKLAGISTLIARRGKVVHLGCYGKLDLAANKPVQSDSLFRIASLTKPITSVGALILHEEGYFNLDDPVSNWIPEFKNFKVMQDNTNINSELADLETEITFWHLLTHTSGLAYGSNREPQEQLEPIQDIYYNAKINRFLGLQLPLPEIIQKITELPLAAQPGAIWRYSLAHDVLGYLIGLISGGPFDAFLHERIFKPLGMLDTGFYVPQDKLDRFGPFYRATEENGLSVFDDLAASPYIRPDKVPSGGAGLISSIPDYYRFMLMLANGGELDGVRLLKPDTVAAMTANHLTGSTFPVRFSGGPWPDMGYGLGIGVLVTDTPQVGWIGISGTRAWIYPSEEMIVIAMPQVLLNWEASDTLERLALEAIAA